MKNIELLALLLTFQVCLVIRVNQGQKVNEIYDDALVSIVVLMLAIFVISTVLAVWRSKILRQKIGTIDATGLLDESSIRQGAALREQEWQARRASEEKKRGELAPQSDAGSVRKSSSGESEAIADAVASRKQASERRNEAALQRRQMREASVASEDGPARGGGRGGG